ncbi:MAG TPA: protein kinase [Bryobacteraceae bacterium]|nr:protein kinase [Bryobacteraceae bacterium]
MPLSAGTKLGPYEILGSIGKGGMGEVYKALDTRLGRIVAIKQIQSGQSSRFEQEARAIAALNHPNICALHDIGPDYMVMEHIEGQPLHGPMGTDEALAVASQIASALAAAHKRGILHRDLKPANILLAESGVKLLDFGLAKTIDTGNDDTLSMEGSIAGTAAYMSPEQAQGRDLDPRSDIFSFGTVLYELLSGRRPFSGACTLEMLNAVVHDDPMPFDSTLYPIVERCLAKDPSQRFQSAIELADALKSPPARSPNRNTVRPSIAVLPFANMSGDREQEYFSDGLAEEIINALARIPELKVIARTSAFAFRGQNADVRRIAETLGVAHVLQGSVRRSSNRIRVTAQLIAASDGGHLWSERYDREVADIFAMQDDIAAAIVAVLQLKLSPHTVRRPAHTPPLAAYEAVMKARQQFSIMSPESFDRGREWLEQAIALDPDYALAHSLLASHLVTIANAGTKPAHELMPAARAAACRALSLEPEMPEALAALARITALYDYNWAEAERLFQRALTQTPISPIVRQLYGGYSLSGQAKRAVDALELARQDDPLDSYFRFLLSMAYLMDGRTEDAIAECRRTLEIDGRSSSSHVLLAWAYLELGNEEEALHAAERGYSLGGWPWVSSGCLAGVAKRVGDSVRAAQALERLGDGTSYSAPTGFAQQCLITGEIEEAAKWASRAIEQRHAPIVMILHQPIARGLRASAHWPAVAKRMNLPADSSGISRTLTAPAP